MTVETLFIGVDVSKFKHDIGVVSATKHTLCKPFVIRENRDSYEFLLGRIRELKEKYQAQSVYIGMESTADYWKNLFHFLRNQPDGFIVVVINPVQTKAYAKSELRRAKTDRVCARDIARFLAEKKPAPSVCRFPIWDNIKDLDTQIQAVKKRQTMSINKLRIELAKVAPEIEHASKTLHGQQILTLLEQFPTAAQIANTSVEELCHLHYGVKHWPLSVNFVTRIQQLAQGSIAHKTGPGDGIVVQSLVRSILHCREQTQFLKEQLKQLYGYICDSDSVLLSLKGISKETAIVLEAYFANVNRFPNTCKFVSFFGMNPVVDESGTKKRASYLEKKGSGRVRHILFMLTISMIKRQQEPFFSYYQRLVAAGKPKLVAIVATMRKLLVIMYSMLKNQKKFDEKKYQNS